jgi:hypothetical protein
MIREPTRWSAGFLIAGLTNALLHFVTFVDFGFTCGYATIFRLLIHDGAGIMVGTPFLILPADSAAWSIHSIISSFQ